MKGERAIFGGDKDAIRRHKEEVTRFNARLLQTLRQELAERRADIEAEQGNPDAQRYYAVEASTLQCQIKSEAAKQAPKQKRVIVNSKPPHRK